MIDLQKKWICKRNAKNQSSKFPTSVRLPGDIDAEIQNIMYQYPHLSQSRIIIDLLACGIDAYKKM